MAILARPSSTVSCTGMSNTMSRRPPAAAPAPPGTSSGNARACAADFEPSPSCSAIAAAQSSALKSFLTSSAIPASTGLLVEHFFNFERVLAVHHAVAAFEHGDTIYFGAHHIGQI